MLDLTLGPSFKVKQWFTGFGVLSFQWIPVGGRVAGKSLSRLYLRNRKVWEVDTWQGHWLGIVGVQRRGVTLI